MWNHPGATVALGGIATGPTADGGACHHATPAIQFKHRCSLGTCWPEAEKAGRDRGGPEHRVLHMMGKIAAARNKAH